MKLVIGYNESIFIGYLELSFTDDRSKTWLSAVLDVGSLFRVSQENGCTDFYNFFIAIYGA